MMHIIDLNGIVGDDFNSASVANQLRVFDGPVAVHLNSGGGIASEGAAIHSLLVAHPHQVTVDVLGIAASAASLIAMAGSRITMRAGSVMMIHDPLQFTIGNSDEHKKTIAQLESIAGAYAKIYATRSGKTPAAARDIMRAETWYDGPQAIAAGFADATDEKRADAYASFDYRKYAKADAAFAHADPSKASWKRVVSEYNNPVNDQQIYWVK